MNGDFLKHLLFWTFVPQAATGFIQRQAYWLFWRAGRAPASGTPAYQRHYVGIYACFIIAYLAYSVYQVRARLVAARLVAAASPVPRRLMPPSTRAPLPPIPFPRSSRPV